MGYYATDAELSLRAKKFCNHFLDFEEAEYAPTSLFIECQELLEFIKEYNKERGYEFKDKNSYRGG